MTIKEEIKWLPAILTFGIPLLVSVIVYIITPGGNNIVQESARISMIFVFLFVIPLLFIAGSTEFDYIYRTSARIERIKVLMRHIKYCKKNIKDIKDKLSFNPQNNLQYLIKDLVAKQKDLRQYEQELRDIRAIKVVKVDDEVDRNVYNYLIETNQDNLLEEYITYKK